MTNFFDLDAGARGGGKKGDHSRRRRATPADDNSAPAQQYHLSVGHSDGLH